MTDAPAQNAATATPELEAAIRQCVRAFYVVARADDLLGPVFNGSIKDWDRHLTTMDDFWSGALLGTERYQAAPFPPHLKLEMTQEHFDRWYKLWAPCAQDNLPEPIRSKAVNIGEHAAHCWGRAYVGMRAQMKEAEAAAAK